MTKKKNLKIAKDLFKRSLNPNGFINSHKARSVLAEITKAKPQGLASILKTYKRLMKAALSREEVVIESSTKIANRNLASDLLKKTGARKVNFQTNPRMIFGAKIKHGDWIWEETLDSKLAQLTIND